MVRLEWYDDMDCAWDDLYDLEVEPNVVPCMLVDVLGVVGTPEERVPRAVRGVGALIIDFFGVSVTLVLRLPRFDDADCSNAFAVLGEGLEGFDRRPAVM